MCNILFKYSTIDYWRRDLVVFSLRLSIKTKMINFSFAIWFYEGNHKEVIMLDVLERQTAFTSSIANNKIPTYLSQFKFHPHPRKSVSRLVQFNLWKFLNSAPTVNT